MATRTHLPKSKKQQHTNYIFSAGLLVILMGIGVLSYGYLLKLKYLLPSGPALPFAISTAVCFILAGLALISQVKRRYLLLKSNLFAVICFSYAALNIAHYYVSFKFSVLECLDYGMAPQTALCFLLIAVALFCAQKECNKNLTQGLLHSVTIITFLVIIGHSLNIPEFYSMTFLPMAIATAVGLFIFSIAASFLHPTIGITGLFTGRMLGNLMARKLFIRIVFVTILISYLRLMAHRKQWVSPEFGTALLLVAFILISLLLIWSTSRTINRIDLKRKMAMENFSTAFDCAPYALILSDEKGDILLINDKTVKLYGYRRKELIGKSMRAIVPKKLHKEFFKSSDSFFASPKPKSFGLDGNLLARRKKGAEFPVELLMTPVNTSSTTFLLATVIDVSHRREQENIIKQQLAELQAKNEELEQFNYISSHDLQEPLRTVSNYISLLEEDYHDQLNDEIKLHLRSMGSSVNRMSQVVRSLLEFGKLGLKKELVKTNVEELVGTVISDLKHLATSSGASVTVGCVLPELYTYQLQLRQLFQNLITNAIKFRKPDTAPVIIIGCREIDGFFEFSVSDNGIGMEPKDHNKIFRIFHRLNNDTKYEGHGIGLANCKKIAEMHGGRIWVESAPGLGSTFKFTILNFKIG
ncbi:MAG: PAS domain S-box protein [Flavobacterium sp.]|nr:MAG: PAS domain S-box protein [Flavobacterium sp.]